MGLAQIHLKLQPMTYFPMVQRPLATANYRMGSGLEVKIRLRTHRLNHINDRREAPGALLRARKLRQLNMFWADA